MNLTFTITLGGIPHKIKLHYTPMRLYGWAPPWPSQINIKAITPNRKITDSDYVLIRAKADEVYAAYAKNRSGHR